MNKNEVTVSLQNLNQNIHHFWQKIMIILIVSADVLSNSTFVALL